MDLYHIVKKTIDNWDPYGLLEIHCPEDEYDHESKGIAEKICMKNSVYEIANIISKIFSDSFNEPKIFSIKKCFNAAKIIKNQMEDDLFYYFVDYYKIASKEDNHFMKFHLLLEDLKSKFESNVINRKKIYNKIIKNISEDDKGYTACIQMIKRLKEWSNSK